MQPAPANRLGESASPYLLQHKDNPVHWMMWGPEAFALARTANRPILLSIGYAACHWCHVMAHESFEDEATAALMNRLYVNVKLDREERPDLDAIYQHALALLGEQGGWPLTMFLTPAGEPFWGGTYFPPEDRWGKPGFRRVLGRIAEIYGQEGEKVRANADQLKSALARMAENAPGGPIGPEAALRAAEHFLGNVDTVHGGLDGAPKFPQCAVFELLWRAFKRTGDERFKKAVTVTLDRMCDGGIYDHLGGGFARYSTDAQWLAPHFEKMLYDNAQLVQLLATAWQETKKPLYAERVAETVGWLLREMRDPAGGFYGTLDADSEGEEGKFYVWSAAEIDRVLGPDAEIFKRAYDVSAHGNWEETNILNRNKAPARLPAAMEAQLAASRAALLAERGTRIRPGLDDKVMADWNGLMIAALARAAGIFGRPDWLAAARAAADFVHTHMFAAGRLRHSWRRGVLDHPGTLDDHATMAAAAIALFEAEGRPADLARAEALCAAVERHFRDGVRGGYFLSADDVADVLVRTKTAFDNATPSGNGVLVHVFARLYYLTGKAEYRERAEALLRAFSGDLARQALGMPLLLTGHGLLERGVQVVIVAPVDRDGHDLAAAAWSASQPDLILQRCADTAALPQGHPARGKTAQGGKTTAYVCRGQVCSLPLTEAETLRQELER